MIWIKDITVLLRYILVSFLHFMSQSTKKRKIRQFIWISLILSTKPWRTDCSMQNYAFQRLRMYYQWKFLWKFKDLWESENTGETFVIAISCSASYFVGTKCKEIDKSCLDNRSSLIRLWVNQCWRWTKNKDKISWLEANSAGTPYCVRAQSTDDETLLPSTVCFQTKYFVQTLFFYISSRRNLV